MKKKLSKLDNLLPFEFLAFQTLNFKDSPRIIHTYSESWIQRYLDRKYWIDDPAQQAKETSSPIIWGQSDESSKIIREARDFSIRSGMSIRVTASNNEEYLITAASSKESDYFVKDVSLNHLSTITSMSAFLNLLFSDKKDDVDIFFKLLNAVTENQKMIFSNIDRTIASLDKQEFLLKYKTPYKFTKPTLFLNQVATDLLKSPLKNQASPLHLGRSSTTDNE